MIPCIAVATTFSSNPNLIQLSLAKLAVLLCYLAQNIIFFDSHWIHLFIHKYLFKSSYVQSINLRTESKVL